ncbi:MAG: dihydrofolate reductase family protein [Saprospiraceae bacterium]|nr:dihydrofolate reductase family protein [Saprospiraceae bacterium]
MMAESTVTIHMVSSLDGFIAKPDESVSWMESKDHYEGGHVLTDEEIHTFMQSVDCYVMGSKTYEGALRLGWPYSNTPVIVLTKRPFQSNRDRVSFYSGDIKQLVEDDLKKRFKNIWMVGGAETATNFLNNGLVDDIVISLVPIILGEGLLFFNEIQKELTLHLLKSQTYRDGVVELHYKVVKE